MGPSLRWGDGIYAGVTGYALGRRDICWGDGIYPLPHRHPCAGWDLFILVPSYEQWTPAYAGATEFTLGRRNLRWGDGIYAGVTGFALVNLP